VSEVPLYRGTSITRNGSDKNEAFLRKKVVNFKNVQPTVFRQRSDFFDLVGSTPQKNNEFGVLFYAVWF